MSLYFFNSRIIKILCIGAIVMGILHSKNAQANEYQKLKAKAEKEYVEGSYSRAYNLYKKIRELKMPEKEREWVSFRLSDTLWRSASSTRSPDSTKIEKARKELEDIIRRKSAEEKQDYIWAKAEESMGDFYWIQRNYQNWSTAWQYYEKALDWWSGAKDIEEARRQYLGIIWRCARPGWADSYYYYGYYGNYLPINIAENVLKISTRSDEKAYAHYLIGMTLQYQGQWELTDRIPDEFEAALKAGKKASWYGDALFYYAEWLANSGKRHRSPNGQWQQKPDYHKALEIYTRLVKEFRKGETRHYQDAKQRIKSITDASLNISVSNIFLPGSEIEAYLSWRNQTRIDFAIYKIDLTRDVSLSKNYGTGNWIHSINTSRKKAVKSWSKKIEKQDYFPGNEMIRLEEKLPAGAYIFEAAGDRSTHRDLILVTDVTLVLKTGKKQTLVYVCDARDGSPVSSARVRIWQRYYHNNSYHTIKSEKQADNDGLAVFDTKSTEYNSEIFAAATAGERQVFGQTYSQDYYDHGENWRIYAFTDRAAYRPEETVHWKMIARLYKSGDYTTPVDKTIEYEIQDARGIKIKSEKKKLNSFGSVWGSIELTKEMALGEYYINIYSENRKLSIGRAALFRLEEYKLPEFKVSIKTPEENGKRKIFRLGDTIEANIQAEYYFGGAVANASVEVVIYQNPYYHWWRPYAEYLWYYNDMYRPPQYWGRGQVVRRETLKTDGRGIARVSFASPRGRGQDLEYRLEARVTDSSRREIIGSETIRVTRHSYEVSMNPEHNIYRPQDNVSVKIKAQDANSNPVSASGKIKITRDRWIEIWIDPAGKTISASDWRRDHPGGPAYPWAGDKPETGWRVKFQGYEHEDILTSSIKTGTNGEAEFNFIAAREGYYRIKWESEETKRSSDLVVAETTVWAATNATMDTGYRHGGMGIIIDKDTVRAGAKAPVMIATSASGKYVLFSVEADDLYLYKLIRMEGTTKFFEIQIERNYVPNVFFNACMVTDVQMYTDVKQVVVPPVEHFLNVEIKSDKGEYQPREEGKLMLNIRDNEGKPVAAEIALSLTDEAVSYIQADYAGDPRQFYYGAKRSQRVITQSTLYLRTYKLVSGKDRQITHGREEDDSPSGQEAIVDEVASRSGYTTERDRVKQPQSLAKKEKQRSMGMLKAAPRAATTAEPDIEAVQVRHDFRATAFWQPDILSGPDGKAVIAIKYPDTLTSWKATARVATSGNKFGVANSTTITKMPLIVRLQAPRFFIAGDSVTISAVINNNTNKDLSVKTALKAQGISIKKASVAVKKVKAGGEARVDWEAEVKEHGEAKITVEARGGSYADAMEKIYPVYEHGLTKFIAKSGKVRGAESIVTIDLPKKRKPETTVLTIQAAPSLAATLLDSLPYLFDYSYGCTEQTLSRFVPAVIVRKTLTDLRINPETIAGKMFGGIEKAYVDKTQPKGQKDFKKLDDMIKQGLNRLYDFQHKDGGWGWWKEGPGDHYMTAYVVWGLTLASEAGLNVKKDVISRSASFLDTSLVEKENQPDIQVWMLHALGRVHAYNRKSKLTAFQEKAFNNAFEQRDRLNAYTRSLLALAAYDFGYKEKARILIRNLENGVVIDNKPDTTILHKSGSDDSSVMGTAHWGNDGIYWRWSDGGIESTSFALKAMIAVDPDNKLIEPAMNWLIKNRRGAQWSNTRDTAIAVFALNDYLRVSGELSEDMEYEILVNGNSIVKQKIGATDALKAPSVFQVKREYIKNGANEIKILNKKEKGAIYFSAQGEYYSLEEPVKAVGNEIFAKRQYYKFVGRPTLLKGIVYDKMPLNDNETIESGQRVETVITVEAKNDYEYLVIEDLKPAGLEAVELRSGQPLYAYEIKPGAVKGVSAGKEKSSRSRIAPRPGDLHPAGRSVWIYQELRDRKIALFIDKLPQGIWEIRYTLRAEVPGKFHGLPVAGHAMYVPEIRCNSDEVRIKVKDAKK